MRRIPRDLITLAASLAVFAGCAVIAADGRVSPAERAVFHAINGLPGWLYRPMLYAQYLGAHNPLDVVGGAAIGLIIAAVLDLILDVARDRGSPLWQRAPAREDRVT